MCPCEARRLKAPSFLLLVGMLLVACAQPAPVQPPEAEPPPGPWPTARFTPPGGAAPPPWPLEGTLSIDRGRPGGVDVHVDTFDLAEDPRWRIPELPPMQIQLVSDGHHVVPSQRGPRPANHPYWELLVEPGRAWTDPERPDRAVAVLPFALKEGNQNCLHYGLLRFTFGEDGHTERAQWQVASETCAYLKFDAWGETTVRFDANPVPGAGRLTAAYAEERAARLPVRPVAALLELEPALDLAALAPPKVDDATAWGLVLDGVHYRSDCPTRQGPHPFCELVALPSYSTAKSLFAGLAFLAMAKRWPEMEALEVPVLVPECDLPDGRWAGVRLRHLVDMTTGNYDSDVFHADEEASKMQAFFLATTNADKLRFACEAWPRQVEPGTKPVYHSTDDYLLGVALQRFLETRLGDGADLHRDVLVERILAPAEPGPLLDHTQRTYDEEGQPFVSYGLYFHPDDVARLGQYLQDDEALAPLLAPADLAGIRFRDRSAMQAWTLSRGEGYYAGFWGFDIAPHAGCDAPAWVPFMSGYGGIRWALPPGGAVYWFFTDGGHGSWMDALIELRDLISLCGDPASTGTTP